MNTAFLQSKAAALAGTTPGKNVCLRQRSAKYSRPVSRRSLKACASAKVFEAQVCAVLGSQWGDEGKGKLVDILAKQYDIVARAQGGANAGHTIYDDAGQRYALHLIPSGILSQSCVCVIGNGVVLHLPGLLEEMDGLAARGVKFDARLLISDRAHLLFDLHKEVDGLREAELAGSKIGTTKRGIGPAYSSKAIRNGLRVSDLKHEEVFQRKLTLLTEDSKKRFGENLVYDEKAEFAKYREMYKRILPFVTDTISYVHEAYEAGKRILVEGANATMLDIDFGTYPYVTSSNPSVGGIATGLGLPPNKFEALIGVVKAYTTRVGGGPYPTELHGDFAEALRSKGHEYGTTTGRPRRVGWLDVVALRYASRVNGFTHLNLTKLDVLDDLPELSIGTAYNSPDGTRHTASVPADVETLEKCTVEYETHPGWQKDISGCRKWEDLPENAQKYVLRVEELVGVPIRWIGVGPGRDAIVEKV